MIELYKFVLWYYNNKKKNHLQLFTYFAEEKLCKNNQNFVFLSK
jgi:hypothetical protein